MYTCICAGVPEGEVRACIAAGARTVEEVGEGCGAGTGCGSCHSRIDVILMAARDIADSKGLAIPA